MSFQLSPYDVLLLKGMKVAAAPPEEMIPLSRHEAALRRQAEMHAAVMAERDAAEVEMVKRAQRLAVERDEARAALRCRRTRLLFAACCVPWVFSIVKAGGWLWAR